MGINHNKIPAFHKKWVGGIMCLYLSLNERAVYNIEADKAAVQAAVDTNYSNALLEGTVNRVKTIKRTMFNKAG